MDPLAMTLGAELGPDGTTFRVDSSVAHAVELCLFDRSGAESERVPLESAGDGSWTVTVGSVADGQRYGFRVDGPSDRALGHACDPSKLLSDPAARRLDGAVTWASELWQPDVDSAPFVPRSVVTAAAELDRLADPVSWDATFVYEAHVGHLTARHPGVPAAHRGRYLGLAAPAVIEHLRALGVTALELLPVQQFVSEPDLVAAGERNVWGYNPLAWGAPHAGYATVGGDAVAELRTAVAALHAAGIEVWLDVVFNHTAEGALGSGTTLSWRGFDNAATYRLVPDGARLADENLSGCGNTIDTRTPAVRRLIAETLVRWVREFGIDGFRFDLAAALIRADGPNRHDAPTSQAPLLAELAENEGLRGVKLVAEPWDLGPGGYAPDQFPVPWRVWNDRFRDDVRRHWTQGACWSDLASRLAGSRDLFATAGEHDATASINAVVTHDGHPLADLVPDLSTRRALLTMVLVAQGVPMVASGDELGRSQAGVRDGYRLEPTEWGLDWSASDGAPANGLAGWLGAAVAAWRSHPALRRSAWVAPGEEAIAWRDPTGTPMSTATWQDEDLGGLVVELAAPTEADHRVLVLMATAAEVTFALPHGSWRSIIDSTLAGPPPGTEPHRDVGRMVNGPAVVVLVDDPAANEG